jgi:ribonuclease VapC
MFLDASALIAILGREPEADLLLEKITQSKSKLFYSSLSVYEAIIGLANKRKRESIGDQVPTPPKLIEECEYIVAGFLDEIGAREVAIGGGMHKKAIEASRTYGKVVDHPAQLNFGDCFSYACAKTYHLPLLFIGNDFSETDIGTV